jgi:hypothetical protein
LNLWTASINSNNSCSSDICNGWHKIHSRKGCKRRTSRETCFVFVDGQYLPLCELPYFIAQLTGRSSSMKCPSSCGILNCDPLTCFSDQYDIPNKAPQAEDHWCHIGETIFFRTTNSFTENLDEHLEQLSMIQKRSYTT